MRHTDAAIIDLVEQLKNSLNDVVRGFGKIVVTNSGKHGEVILTITPENSRAANIEIILDKDFGAYLTVGRASIFEIPFEGKKYTEADFACEITKLISGVVNGGFQEDVISSKGDIIGASGIINAGGNLEKAVSDAWMKIGSSLLSKKAREHQEYEPYRSG